MAFVQIIQIIEFGAFLAGLAAGVASLIFFLWAFVGRRASRNWRLRVALASSARRSAILSLRHSSVVSSMGQFSACLTWWWVGGTPLGT
jgi:hypothetical protein